MATIKNGLLRELRLCPIGFRMSYRSFVRLGIGSPINLSRKWLTLP
ncbi:MAG: hypothetical protein RL584_2188 [Pseudomonadota bacterium]|jgi:hypothetical protein